MPIEQAELHWRLAALLRLRNQSLTLHSRKRDLERQVDVFKTAQDIADVGAWEYDTDDGEWWWSDEFRRIHDLPEDSLPSREASFQCYHPEDRPIIEEAFEAAVEDGDPYDLELRFIDGEDDHRWVRTTGEPQHVDGKLSSVRGIVQDITDRKIREQ